MTDPASPRRYTVKFDLSAAQSGNLLGLLVSEVEGMTISPTSDPTRLKMSFVTTLDALATIVGCIAPHAEGLIIAPYTAPQTEAMRPFAQRARNVPIPPGTNVTKFAPRKSGKQFDASSRGALAVKGVLDGLPIAYATDFEHAFAAAGLAKGSIGMTLSKLAEHGLIIRASRGAYRLPTEQEKLDSRRESNNGN